MRERGSEAAARWHGLVSEQVESGKSVAAFCRERGVPASQMFSWKKRFREKDAAKFVEVAVTPAVENTSMPATRGKAIEVRLKARSQSRGGAWIRREPPAHPAWGIGERGVIGLPSLRALDGAQATRIWLAAEATDMRCGFDRLAERVKAVISQDPLSGHLFVFRSRRGERLKILTWDRDGYVLWYN